MVRSSELTAARRAATERARQSRDNSGGTILARFQGLLDGSTEWGIITIDGGPEIQVPLSPGYYFKGALVSVLVDSAGRPVRVLSVRSERPDGDEDSGDQVEGVDRIQALPGMLPREITAEQARKIRETAENLDQAQQDWQDAQDRAEQNFQELDDQLSAAFPDGPFNVNAGIQSSATATLTAAALDAAEQAQTAAQAARDAAQAYADGEIGDAELRAAQAAQAKADAARDAAIQTANEHADHAADQAKEAAMVGAAAEAELLAQAAAQAAQTAAQAYADGEIGEAELRAATDAQTRADSARDAAVLAANEHSATVAGAAEQAAIQAAQTYADDKTAAALTQAATDAQARADAAAQAAQQAAEEHADLVAQGANEAAIQAAALAAQAMADAAQAAAESHADAQAAAAEQAAKTHADNEAARAKQEALTEAATDAQARAESAASAAQDAAEAYALAQAQGLSGQALVDAQAYADSAKQAAIEAADTAAQAYAESARNTAIDAAALTAQTKADVAQQAAIDAAAQDAQAKANAAAQAAQQAAEEHADLVAQGASQAAIDAAAQDAQAKADAAQQAAIQAASTDAQGKADAAQQAAIQAASTDAQAKANAAATAAETAAKEHADLVAQGASQAAIDAAATDAQAKADAAKQAAIDAASTDAQTKANSARDAAISAAATDAASKADSARDAAISAAATDAQAKADAAAQAAQTAAEAYALAQAQGLSGQALADAKAHADSAAAAAEQAATAAAQAGLDALEVGGRNYIVRDRLSTYNPYNVLDEVSPDARKIVSTYVGTGPIFTLSVRNFMPEPGWWTVSGQIDINGEIPANNPITSNGTNTYWPATGASKTYDPETGRFVITQQADGSSNWVLHANMIHSQGDVLTFYDLKFEKGTKATDWTPAPEDVDKDIADAQALASTADGKADTAITDATTAKTDAQQAVTQAGQAVTTAGAADTKAGQAQSAAQQAATQAGQAVATANAADTAAQQAATQAGQAVQTAGAAQAVADDALSKYGPLDQRTLNAQAAADAAAQAAQAAQTKANSADTKAGQAQTAAGLAQAAADAAQAAADSAAAGAQAADQKAVRAMSSADGKNAITYLDVTQNPGPAPTQQDGAERNLFDIHRNVARTTFTDSAGVTHLPGAVLAEWMWSGTAWTSVHMGDGILRSLDVGKLTAGHANISNLVSQKIWGALGVFDKLDVRQDAYVAGVNLKDHAVTARTLNVVPDTGTGGMELKPQGFRIIPGTDDAGSGGSSISMRSDEQEWIDFVKAGRSTFSVNRDGALVAEWVNANQGIQLGGQDLQEMLDRFPRGNLGRVRMSGTNPSVGTSAARLVQCSIRTPPGNRLIRISVSLSSNAGNPRRGTINVRQTTQNNVKATNSSIKRWDFQTHFAESFDYSFVASVDELGWPLDETITLGVFVNSGTTGESIPFMASRDQTLTIDDIGPVTDLQLSPAYVPSSGGGSGGSGGESDKGTRDYTWTRKSSWTQSFMNGGSSRYPYGTGRAYQGRYLAANGTLASMIGFISAQTTLNGATVKSIKIKLKNDHAYSSQGVTAYIGIHGHGSAPTAFAHSAASVVTAHFNRGQTRTLTIPSQYYAGFKNGTYRGVSLYINSTSATNYGYWDGTNAELIIDYEK